MPAYLPACTRVGRVCVRDTQPIILSISFLQLNLFSRHCLRGPKTITPHLGRYWTVFVIDNAVLVQDIKLCAVSEFTNLIKLVTPYQASRKAPHLATSFLQMLRVHSSYLVISREWERNPVEARSFRRLIK